MSLKQAASSNGVVKAEAKARSARAGKSMPGYGSLFRLLRPVHAYLVICILLSTLGAGAGLLAYIAIAETARAALGSEGLLQASGAISMWVWIGVAGGAARLVLVFLSSRLGHYADAELLHDIRTKLVRRLGVYPIGWFRSAGSGAVKKAMGNDLEDMHQLIAHVLGEILGAWVAIIVGVGYLLLVDWRMTGVTLAVLVLWAICFQVAMRSMSEHMARLHAAETRISAASIEYADGISVVKTFGTGGRVLERFAGTVHEYAAAFKAWVDETMYSSALARLFGSEMAVLGAVTAVGASMIASGHLPPADLLPFLVIGIGMPTAILPAVLGSQGLRKGRMSAANIEALLARPGLAEAANPQMPRGYDIVLDRVSFSYETTADAVVDISATCAPGTITALVGPSGSGKSTLASLVPRFYDVSAGAIRVGGIDIRDIPTQTLLSSMALVFQDVVLLRDTVRENIRIGRPDATDDDVRAAAEAAQIHGVIQRLPHGYDTMLGTGSAGLSGGERQRLTIARAILSGAPIVVLDEATASLDPDNESAVQQALATLLAGKTVIVIAHRLNTIAQADQILVLEGGRVVERGQHDELLAKEGLYARMWRAQQSGTDA